VVYLATPPLCFDAVHPAVRSAEHADDSSFGHQGCAAFYGDVLEAAVESVSSQTVRYSSGTVGELGAFVVESHSNGVQCWRELPHLIADAEGVELVHPGWLDEVSGGWLAAWQRR